MDEYLFITLAKLKADRLKLEREKRGTEPDPEQLRLAQAATPRPSAVPHPVRNSILTRWFSQQTSWREQS